MSISNKQRLDKEAIYKESNSDVRSVCSGRFYNRAKKVYEECKNCANCFKYNSYKTKSNDTPEVKFHYIESFRRCDFHTKNSDIIRDNIITAIYKILYLNELTLCFVNDVFAIEKDNDDKEVKKLVKAAKKRQYRYEDMMGDILKDKQQTYVDFCDAVDDVVQPLVKDMRDMFDKLYSTQTDNTSIARRVACINSAIILCTLSDKVRETIINQLVKVSSEAYNLQVYNLADMKHVLQDLIKWEKRKTQIDLNCEEACSIVKDKTSEIIRQLNSSLIYKYLKKE